MRTEKEKKLAGALYNTLDMTLSEERLKARLILKAFNDSREEAVQERKRILYELYLKRRRGRGDILLRLF